MLSMRQLSGYKQDKSKQTNKQTKGSQNPYRFLKTLSLFNVTNLVLGKNGNSPSWVTTTLLLNSSWQPWQGLRYSCELWVRRQQSEQSCTLNLEVSLFNSLVLFPYFPAASSGFLAFRKVEQPLEFNMVTARDGNLISCFLVFQTLTSFFCSFCNFN